MAKEAFLPKGFSLSGLMIICFTFLEIVWYYTVPTGFLWLHGCFAICTLAFTLFSFSKNYDTRFLIPFALFFIPFAWAGGLLVSLSLILYLIDHYITQPISSLISSLFPEQKMETSEYIYERLLYRLEDTRPERVPIPFKDIMKYGNYNQKRIAIEKMLRYFKPEFSPALKMGLQDPSSAIKVQTATALSFIDHKMFDRFTLLKIHHLDDPEDPFLLKGFAEYGAYYALSGILDEDRLNDILSQTIPTIHAYLKMQPKDYTLKFSLAELYLKQGDSESAQIILEEILNAGFDPKAAYSLMNILFEKKEYNAVRELAQKALKENKELENNEYIKNMALAWANGTND